MLLLPWKHTRAHLHGCFVCVYVCVYKIVLWTMEYNLLCVDLLKTEWMQWEEVGLLPAFYSGDHDMASTPSVCFCMISQLKLKLLFTAALTLQCVFLVLFGFFGFQKCFLPPERVLWANTPPTAVTSFNLLITVMQLHAVKELCTFLIAAGLVRASLHSLQWKQDNTLCRNLNNDEQHAYNGGADVVTALWMTHSHAH